MARAAAKTTTKSKSKPQAKPTTKPKAKPKRAAATPAASARRGPVERIVPIPPIDVYSELPFALVERNGERIASDMPALAAKAATKKPIKTAKPA